MEKHRKPCTGKADAGDCREARSGVLTDTWPQQVWLLTGTGRDGDRTAASCPWSRSTFTSEHMMHSTHSALTVQPTSEHCPHSIAARPSHQQRGLGAAGGAPLLNKASSGGGGRLHSSHTPRPTSAASGFLTKISLCPTPPLPDHRALNTAQLLIQTFLPGLGTSSRGTVPVTSHKTRLSDVALACLRRQSISGKKNENPRNLPYKGTAWF